MLKTTDFEGLDLACVRDVRLWSFDVDGVLTNGQLGYVNGQMMQHFSAQDGLGLMMVKRLLPHLRVIFVTTGGSSNAVVRGEHIGIDRVYRGIWRKEDVLEEESQTHGIAWKNIAHVGDDMNDYRAVVKCGFSAVPANGVKALKDVARYVSPYAGGDGMVRHLMEGVLFAHGIVDPLKVFDTPV